MILFRLLLLPVTAPAAGIRYCIEKVVEYAEYQFTDDEPVREQLLELHLELEEGRVSEEEYAEREAVLLARLREIREYRKQQARDAAEASAPGEGAPGEGAPDGVGAPPEGHQRTVVIEVPEELR